MTRITCYDPYNLWSTKWGVEIRRLYYEGKLSGKLGAVVISVFDLLFPNIIRSLAGIKPRHYPILSAHEYLRQNVSEDGIADAGEALADIKSQSIKRSGSVSWGLGFHWMSKNGLYAPDVPFVTHTPYVMEALLALASEDNRIRVEAMELFQATWGFLGSLKIMHQTNDELALSYAPVDEPHIVINANSYAAFAYALHAVHGSDENRFAAREKAEHLARWVVGQQNENGSWFYLADRGPWDMIDGFHSCFVVRNLNKMMKLLPESESVVQASIERGWAFIRENIFEQKTGLCRRYFLRPRRDPFALELYDQAEYLGLLVDFGLLDEASEFAGRVEQRFKNGEHWYCRIDIFGRRWGRDFLRWGIAPFWYQRARLDRAMKGGL